MRRHHLILLYRPLMFENQRISLLKSHKFCNHNWQVNQKMQFPGVYFRFEIQSDAIERKNRKCKHDFLFNLTFRFNLFIFNIAVDPKVTALIPLKPNLDAAHIA